MPVKRKRTPQGKTIPEDIRLVLDRLLTKKSANTAFKKLRLLAECKKRIGEDFAQHLKPDNIHNGILFCLVDSPSWVQQYQFYSSEILRRVNTPPLPEAITGLRFTVGRIDDSEYLCKIGEPTERSSVTITPQDAAELEEAAAAVHPELQKDIRSLIEGWLAYVQVAQSEES